MPPLLYFRRQPGLDQSTSGKHGSWAQIIARVVFVDFAEDIFFVVRVAEEIAVADDWRDQCQRKQMQSAQKKQKSRALTWDLWQIWLLALGDLNDVIPVSVLTVAL